MQNLGVLQSTGLSLELFHVQSKTSFELPPNLAVIRIGKPNEQITPDIDVSDLPDAEVVSRQHGQIQVEESNYYMVDEGSSNGTYLNGMKLQPHTRYLLNLGDKIDLGQQTQLTFIFQHQENTIPIYHPTKINPLTVIQPQTISNNQTIDRASKVVGSLLMLAGIVIFAANTHIGVFVPIPGVLLLIAGLGVIIWRRNYRNLGLVLIALGIAVTLFTANVFASINLLSILASSAFFIGGYQLFHTGKVFNYSLLALRQLIQK